MGDSKHLAFSGAARRAHEAALKRGMKDADDVGELFGSMSDISAAADSELGFAEPAPIPPEPAADAARARALGVAGEPDLDGVPEGFFEPGEPRAHEADELGESDLVLDQSAFMADEPVASISSFDGRLDDPLDMPVDERMQLQDIPSGFFDIRDQDSRALHLDASGRPERDDALDLEVPSVLGAEPSEAELCAARPDVADGHLTIPPVARQIVRPRADTGFARRPVREPGPAGAPPSPTRATERRNRPSGSHAAIGLHHPQADREAAPQQLAFPALPAPLPFADVPAMLFDERDLSGPVAPVRAKPKAVTEAAPIPATTLPTEPDPIEELRQHMVRPTESGLAWAEPPTADTVPIRPVGVRADGPVSTLMGIATVGDISTLAAALEPDQRTGSAASAARTAPGEHPGPAPAGPSAAKHFQRLEPTPDH